MFQMFDGRLIIADLQEEDAGVIECRVSNLAGYVVVSAELLVKGIDYSLTICKDIIGYMDMYC